MQTSIQRKIEVSKFIDSINRLYLHLFQTLNGDMLVERETFQSSRSGFDLMYNDLQKKYDDERLSKQVNLLENTFFLQINPLTE
jgi:hypothetical protein